MLAMQKRAGQINLVCGCFLEFGLPALGKTSEYSLLMLVRRVVQSDFSIFVRKGGENSGNVRLHTNKKLYKNTRKHYTQFRSIRLWRRYCCLPLRLKHVDLLLGSRENSHRRFVYYFCHTLYGDRGVYKVVIIPQCL